MWQGTWEEPREAKLWKHNDIPSNTCTDAILTSEHARVCFNVYMMARGLGLQCWHMEYQLYIHTHDYVIRGLSKWHCLRVSGVLPSSTNQTQPLKAPDKLNSRELGQNPVKQSPNFRKGQKGRIGKWVSKKSWESKVRAVWGGGGWRGGMFKRAQASLVYTGVCEGKMPKCMTCLDRDINVMWHSSKYVPRE